MRPARRKHLIEKRNRNTSSRGLILKILIPLLIIVAAFVFLKLNTKYWDGKNKFEFTFREGNGDVAVMVLDPKLGESTTLIIPGDTEVNVSRNYGSMRIKNVWQLGQNEKVGEILLSETVTQNFLFPNILWSDTDAGSVDSKNLPGIIKFVFFPIKTNISFGDRLWASLFALQVQDLNRSRIDLGKSQFLHKGKLDDGQVGYSINGDISQRLTAYFSDNNFATSDLRFYLIDETGEPLTIQMAGRILEVLGGKVVGIDRRDINPNLDCQVLGQNKYAVKKAAQTFSCQMISGKSNFDLEMTFGGKFVKRF